MQELLESLESFGSWVIVGSAKRWVWFWEQKVLVMMVYTSVWLSDVYWQIEDLITLNPLLIVDGIVVEDVDLHYYLNSALSNGFYLVEIFAFELTRINKGISMKKLRNIEQCNINGSCANYRRRVRNWERWRKMILSW